MEEITKLKKKTLGIKFNEAKSWNWTNNCVDYVIVQHFPLRKFHSLLIHLKIRIPLQIVPPNHQTHYLVTPLKHLPKNFVPYKTSIDPVTLPYMPLILLHIIKLLKVRLGKLLWQKNCLLLQKMILGS